MKGQRVQKRSVQQPIQSAQYPIQYRQFPNQAKGHQATKNLSLYSFNLVLSDLS